MILGIDPGLTGALAFRYSDGGFAIHDMPVSARTVGKGNQVNEDALADLLYDYANEEGFPDPITLACIEQVNAMPPFKGKERSTGTASMFAFGMGFGVVRGVVAALGIRREYVPPQTWKKHFGLAGKDKDAARTKAMELFPKLTSQLSRKKDIDRADAVLIAEYGYQKLFNQKGDIFK
jgi:crossover junction endodeoxyribonuclease RuvC